LLIEPPNILISDEDDFNLISGDTLEVIIQGSGSIQDSLQSRIEDLEYDNEFNQSVILTMEQSIKEKEEIRLKLIDDIQSKSNHEKKLMEKIQDFKNKNFRMTLDKQQDFIKRINLSVKNTENKLNSYSTQSNEMLNKL